MFTGNGRIGVVEPCRGSDRGWHTTTNRDDGAYYARQIGVAAKRPVRFEVAVALDGKTEPPAHRCQFWQRDVADLGAAETEVAETECNVLVG